jgi:hypothetical protein
MHLPEDKAGKLLGERLNLVEKLFGPADRRALDEERQNHDAARG